MTKWLSQDTIDLLRKMKKKRIISTFIARTINANNGLELRVKKTLRSFVITVAPRPAFNASYFIIRGNHVPKIWPRKNLFKSWTWMIMAIRTSPNALIAKWVSLKMAGAIIWLVRTMNADLSGAGYVIKSTNLITFPETTLSAVNSLIARMNLNGIIILNLLFVRRFGILQKMCCIILFWAS